VAAFGTLLTGLAAVLLLFRPGTPDGGGSSKQTGSVPVVEIASVGVLPELTSTGLDVTGRSSGMRPEFEIRVLARPKIDNGEGWRSSDAAAVDDRGQWTARLRVPVGGGGYEVVAVVLPAHGDPGPIGVVSPDPFWASLQMDGPTSGQVVARSPTQTANTP
jgi:hypothetical protein